MTTTIKGSIHILDDIVPKTNRIEIIPYKIIVARSGVLTLAFKAWPKPLMEIKQRINDLPEFRDTSENFGTKWPKITLASLINDDVPPLTLDQLQKNINNDLLMRWFELNLLSLSGFLPDLYSCQISGNTLLEGDHLFSSVNGGLVEKKFSKR